MSRLQGTRPAPLSQLLPNPGHSALPVLLKTPFYTVSSRLLPVLHGHTQEPPKSTR